MRKFKMRFSYFAIAGIIGIVLQLISLVVWKNIDVTASQIVSKTSVKVFNSFVLTSILMVIGSLFMGCFAYGIIRCIKKESFYTKYSAYVILSGEGLNFLIGLLYLIVAASVRTKMFSEKVNSETLYAFSIINMLSLLIVAVGLLVFSISLIKYKEQDTIGKIGIGTSIATNGFASLMMIILLISGIFSSSLSFVTNFIEVKETLSTSYTFSYPSLNGFTVGQIRRLIMLLQEINLSYLDGLGMLKFGVVISLITIIGYFVSVVGNVIFISTMMIKSFDIEKDDDPMSI